MSECTHDCSSCGQDCASRAQEPVVPTADTKIKHIIGVLSGKGGVGKSMVSSLLAVELAQQGYNVGIMDADITGPSIPKMFGLHQQLYGDEAGIFPAVSTLGIKIVSINMMLENEDDAVLWRGPILGGLIKQFYTEVHWGELDYLLIDMPPGTGDIHISLVQDIPVSGAVIVTTPQNVALADVEKGVNMFRNKSIAKPIYGLIENMSWFTPEAHPDERYYLFGRDGGAEMAERFGLDLLGQIPIVQGIREGGDSGEPVALGTRPDSLAFLDIARRLSAKV